MCTGKKTPPPQSLWKYSLQQKRAYGVFAGRNHTTNSVEKVLTIGSALICRSFPFRCRLPQRGDAERNKETKIGTISIYYSENSSINTVQHQHSLPHCSWHQTCVLPAPAEPHHTAPYGEPAAATSQHCLVTEHHLTSRVLHPPPPAQTTTCIKALMSGFASTFQKRLWDANLAQQLPRPFAHAKSVLEINFSNWH